MTLSYFAAQVLNGLTVGAVYALVALGFSIVYGLLGFVNFAHSEVFAAGAFAGWAFVGKIVEGTKLPAPFQLLLTIFIGAAFGALFALVIERVGYRPFLGGDRLKLIVTSLAIAIATRQLLIELNGAAVRPVPELFDQRTTQLVTLSILAVVFGLLWLGANRSRWGLLVRAAAQDSESLRLLGVRPRPLIVLAFGLGGACAGLAGVSYGAIYGFIGPQMGFAAGLKAFLVAVIGGVGSLEGCVAAGLGIGIIEALILGFLPQALSAYREPLFLALLALFLILKPRGLRGGPEERV